MQVKANQKNIKNHLVYFSLKNLQNFSKSLKNNKQNFNNLEQVNLNRFKKTIYKI